MNTKIALLTVDHKVIDARVTHKQAASLASAGFHVGVFACGTEIGTSMLGPVELHAVGKFNPAFSARAKLLPKITTAAAAWQPRMIACHDPIALIGGLRLSRLLRIPLIFDCHELYYESLPSRLPWPANRIVRRLAAWSLAHLARKCDWITVVSPPSQDFYRAARGDDRVTIIHNSPRLEWCPPCSHNVDGPITICHEGNLNTGRGLVQMLEALAIARKRVDVRLMLIGKVEEQDTALFDNTVRRLGIADHLDGPKWVSYDQVGTNIAKCQIGLVAMQPTPNNFKSLSNKLYNYMGSGLAVIGMAGSATGDLIAQHEAGLIVDPTNADDIADAIVKLASDHQLRFALGTNGRQAIEQHCGWHHMAAQLETIYAHVANEQQPTKQSR